MLQLMCTFHVLGVKAAESLGARVARRDDRGQTAAEYLGIIVIVAAIITLVAASGAGGAIRDGIKAAITKITGVTGT